MQESTQGQRRPGLARDEVKSTIDDYNVTWDSARTKADVGHKYATVTTQFYNLVTDFYEIGWGRSFHFAVMRQSESFKESLDRHDQHIAERLGVGAGKKVIDFGCGVGGPMRVIARATGAHVTGVNISAYQLSKAQKYNEQAGLGGQTALIETDFMKVPVEDGTFDAGYAVEALCHAFDKKGVFQEIARVLKPGSVFCSYEWCLTPLYDDANPEHRRIREGIEKGNAIASLCTYDEIKEAVLAAGFELIDAKDRTPECDGEVPWYSPLADLSLRTLVRTGAGRTITNALTGVLEKVGLAPKGTRAVSTLLNGGADALVAGGKIGIFTPMYFVHARKKA